MLTSWFGHDLGTQATWYDADIRHVKRRNKAFTPNQIQDFADFIWKWLKWTSFVGLTMTQIMKMEIKRILPRLTVNFWFWYAYFWSFLFGWLDFFLAALLISWHKCCDGGQCFLQLRLVRSVREAEVAGNTSYCANCGNVPGSGSVDDLEWSLTRQSAISSVWQSCIQDG